MLESLLQYSIRARYLIIVLTLAVSAFGLYSLNKLPIDAVPDITNVQVQINTELVGFSPTEIEKQVTFNIENSLSGIAGLDYTRSLSRTGFSQVTAVFKDGTDIYFARQQVSERLVQARDRLPPGAEPVLGPISTGLGEVYMWTIEFGKPAAQADAHTLKKYGGYLADGSYQTPEGQILKAEYERTMYLRTLQDWVVSPQIRSVPGVAGVDSIGGYDKIIQVKPDPSKLISYGLTYQDLILALDQNNVSSSGGFVERFGEAFQVRADGRVANMEELRFIKVATRHGTAVRLGDVSDILIGKEVRTGAASKNGNEVVVGTALMLIGENSRTVAKQVDDKIIEIRKSLPRGIEIKAALNRTTLVDATIRTVRNSLIEGALLVIVILFVMLGNIRAALVTATAIPISMLMTAIGMVQTKMSGNLMSLGAIDFGLVIDGAVIIVENCLRCLAEKQHELKRHLTLQERLKVVFEASKQVRGATAFGEAIIIAVYIPILTLTGVEGKMFQPMAMTVIFALVAAFILSLTFVPAMVAVFVSGNVEEKEIKIVSWTHKKYLPILDSALANPKKVIRYAVVSFVASLILFSTFGTEFIPKLDEHNMAFHSIRTPSTSLDQSLSMTKITENIVKEMPEVEFIFSKTGTAEVATDPMPPNVTDSFVILKPHSDWPRPRLSKTEFVEKISKGVEASPGNAYEFTQPIEMRFNELISGVRSDVAVKVFGDDFDEMQKSAQQVAAVLKAIPGAADVRVEQTGGLPTLNVNIRRADVARYGLNVSEIQDVLTLALNGRESGLVFEGDRRFGISLRLGDEYKSDIDKLGRIPVPLSHDDKVPAFVLLSDLADIEMSEGPNQISRENGKRRIVVQANVRGTDLGSFVSSAQAEVSSKVQAKPGQWFVWGGQYENLISAQNRLMLVVPLCFLLIFGMLYKAFDSTRFALLVFSGVPLALTGGILALWLRSLPFSLSAAVGFIALSGVAVLNGLVIVSFINELRKNGMDATQAIRTGSEMRLRPVLMTALVASLGFVPMALNTGTGAEVQRPLATVVIGGIISSTLLTLVVLPALYSMFCKTTEVRK